LYIGCEMGKTRVFDLFRAREAVFALWCSTVKSTPIVTWVVLLDRELHSASVECLYVDSGVIQTELSELFENAFSTKSLKRREEGSDR